MKVRDPVHGFVCYNENEERIINTHIFQRLRDIKQLALAYYVYPGAHHSRFEHSLGVMHLCKKVANYLELSPELKKTLRYAGLLHDIGHGPFSHVSEQVIDKKLDKSVLNKYRADNTQELLSILLIKYNDEINEILSEVEKVEITSLLQKQKYGSIQKDIISGPIDVDKIDYLLRDSYFAGVEYGSFDVDKVLDSLTPIAISSKINKLGIKEEGVYAVEQLILAKYHMNVQVYRHKIRRITDAMIIKSIELAFNENVKEIVKLYRFEDNKSYIDNYSTYNDMLLVNTILNSSTDLAKNYLSRLIQRKLFKQIFSIEINNENFEDIYLRQIATDISGDQIKNITEEVSDILSVPNEMIIFDKQTFKNPTFKNVAAKINLDEIIVKTPSGTKKGFKEVSSIFGNYSDPERNVIYIYAPLDSLLSRSTRKEFIQSKRETIYTTIKEVLAQ
ncbi:MAG: HD domain-containing protein [Methanothrix sp.]